MTDLAGNSARLTRSAGVITADTHTLGDIADAEGV